MFIHGGYWRSLEPSSFSQMARGLNARGVTVAVPGYDLCPQVTIGDIIAQAQAACIYLWRRFGRRIMVSGHSAGGHLAACMVATDWKTIERDVPVRQAILDAKAVPAERLDELLDLLELTRGGVPKA